MSDIIKPDGDDPRTEANSGPIPHSGNLGLDQPVVESTFPLREDILVTPDHPGTLVEDKKSRSKYLVWGAGGLTLLGAGLGIGMSMGGGDDGKVIAETPTTEQPAPTTSAPPETAPTTTVETVPEPMGVEPTLMTASTPQDLLGQFSDNIHCMLGDNPIEAQYGCFSHITGDRRGSLSDKYQSLIAQTNNYRLDHPDFEFFYNPTLVESRMSENEAVLVVDVEDAAGLHRQRYTFLKAPVTIEQGGVDDTNTIAWVLDQEKTLNPGEVSFD